MEGIRLVNSSRQPVVPPTCRSIRAMIPEFGSRNRDAQRTFAENDYRPVNKAIAKQAVRRKRRNAVASRLGGDLKFS